MEPKRVIPCLLLRDKGLVKTVKFSNARYIGDPINAVKIFNEKEVDELIFLDIDASRNKKNPDYDVIKSIGSECFMPFCYGGGINSLQQIEKIINSGAEKICINTAAFNNHDLIINAANNFGSSTVVVGMDVKINLFGKYRVFINGGTKSTSVDPVSYAKLLESLGAGEIFLNSIDRDGTMMGYDIPLVQSVSNAVNIPVIACGGAGKNSDLRDAILLGGASAVSAGSLFVFQGKRKAVLITYPEYNEIKKIFSLE